MLATLLTRFKDALMTNCSGTSRPTNLQAGGIWVDITNAAAPVFEWTMKLYTGSADISVFTISTLNGIGGTLTADATFDVSHIAADTAGALFELVKNRIVNNGQISDGDVVGEIRWVGNTNSGTNPTVAYLRWTSTDNETTSAYGGTLSICSTADATATLTEHISLLNGYVETVKPHSVYSQQSVAQNVATTASITALDASVMIAEMTGSTTTNIHGVDATGVSDVVTIHNRSTAGVTVKHESSSATSTNRIKLPKSQDVYLAPDSSITLYYNTTDTRWKLKQPSGSKVNKYIEQINGVFSQWTCPAGISVIHISTKPRASFLSAASGNPIIQDAYGNLYAWGFNSNGYAGVGDTTPRSSPIAVLGGFQAVPNYEPDNYPSAAIHTFLIDRNTGNAYGWGQNGDGRLGLGDTTPRSSPVAVLGGLKFMSLRWAGSAAFGLTVGGYAYAWGINTNGQLGVGDVTPRSSPVAVLGGFQFARLTFQGVNTVWAITPAGVAYAWGSNTGGVIGDGTAVKKSSPVAVLGGLTWKKIAVTTDPVVYGLASSGAAYSWGTASTSSPVAVAGGLTFSDIITGERLVYGLTSDGTAYAWGVTLSGAAGDGTGTNTSLTSPKAVLGGLKFMAIRTCNSTASTRPAAFGITADGSLYAWGDNSVGQLGVGDTTPRSSPVAVLGGIKFQDVMYTESCTLGISVDGVLYAWGSNTQGQLGLGDVTSRSSPVAVLGAFSAGNSVPKRGYSLAVTPGVTYNVCLSDGNCYFGIQQIGTDLYGVTLEYQK